MQLQNIQTCCRIHAALTIRNALKEIAMIDKNKTKIDLALLSNKKAFSPTLTVPDEDLSNSCFLSLDAVFELVGSL